jgi:beta-glucosidase
MEGHTYRFMEEEPLYRFGYGLSYTSFEYSDLRLSPGRVSRDEDVVVTAQVQNLGQCAGEEVAQLYVSDLESSVPVPLLHLEGFQRLRLRPGQTRTVAFRLRPDQLAAYDDEGRAFVEPGQFEVTVGGGQPEDPASGAVSGTLVVEED